MDHQKKIITIVGGKGKMGQKFYAALQDFGHTVMICDKGDGAQCTTAIGMSDVVIVSVPIRVVADLIKKVAPLMKNGALLTDITSVKIMPMDTMRDNATCDVEIMGGHPLFGPTVDWRGQHFIVCTERAGNVSAWYREFLCSLGVEVIDMTPEEHDRHMAVIQCLTHFSNLSLGIALEHMHYDLIKGDKIATAIYQMRLYGAGRILAQDPDLYADIQRYNPYAKEVAQKYLASVQELCDTVMRDDTDGFVRMFRQTQK
jgi:prephenate dehydrogenase